MARTLMRNRKSVPFLKFEIPFRQQRPQTQRPGETPAFRLWQWGQLPTEADPLPADEPPVAGVRLEPQAEHPQPQPPFPFRERKTRRPIYHAASNTRQITTAVCTSTSCFFRGQPSGFPATPADAAAGPKTVSSPGHGEKRASPFPEVASRDPLFANDFPSSSHGVKISAGCDLCQYFMKTNFIFIKI